MNRPYPLVRLALALGGIALLLGTSTAMEQLNDMSQTPNTADEANNESMRQPQAFEENRGQAGPDAAFVSRGDGYAVRLDPDGIDLAFPAGPTASGPDSLRLVFLGAENRVTMAGVGPLPGTVNYLAGPDPRRWITDSVATFRSLAGPLSRRSLTAAASAGPS